MHRSPRRVAVECLLAWRWKCWMVTSERTDCAFHSNGFNHGKNDSSDVLVKIPPLQIHSINSTIDYRDRIPLVCSASSYSLITISGHKSPPHRLYIQNAHGDRKSILFLLRNDSSGVYRWLWRPREHMHCCGVGYWLLAFENSNSS